MDVAFLWSSVYKISFSFLSKGIFFFKSVVVECDDRISKKRLLPSFDHTGAAYISLAE